MSTEYSTDFAIEALLMDLDGTLTHTDPIHLRAIQALLNQEGLSIDEEGFRRHVSGRSNLEIGLRFFPNRPEDERASLLSRKEALFREYAVDLVPLAGALEFMDQAKAAGTKLALVTNAPRENVEHMLRAITAWDRFDLVIYGDELERPKPDPLPYLQALSQLGVKSHAALAFEDSLPGVRSAVAAGLRTVGLTTTQSSESLMQAGAHLIMSDYLDPRLRGLFARPD